MSKKSCEKLAIHGGEPVKKTPYTTKPKHSLEEWQALKPIFQRGSIPMARGPEVMKLRKEFCKRTGLKYAVTTSSGTAALHAATGALGIGRGDEVITSPVTDMGTVIAITAQNAVTVFADIDPETLMMTPATIAKKITSRTKAIIVVHWCGLCADMPGIMKLARKHKIAVIEDVAQSYNAKIGKKLAGTFGDISCWSLNESKHIGAGDGGVMLTNNRKLARRADLFADKCYDREAGKMNPFMASYNYRMNALAAGVSLVQLKSLNKLCSKRHKDGVKIDKALAKTDGVAPRRIDKDYYATYWRYNFNIIPEQLTCKLDQFAKALRAEGTMAHALRRSLMNWPLFKEHPDDKHACGENCPLYKGKTPDYETANYPGLSRLQDTTIQLPFNESYSAKDIDETIAAIKKVAAYYLKK